jgi:hypothetical protein
MLLVVANLRFERSEYILLKYIEPCESYSYQSTHTLRLVVVKGDLAR